MDARGGLSHIVSNTDNDIAYVLDKDSHLPRTSAVCTYCRLSAASVDVKPSQRRFLSPSGSVKTRTSSPIPATMASSLHRFLARKITKPQINRP